MSLYIGSDHAGYNLKEQMCGFFASNDIHFQDIGAHSEQSCHYPDVAFMMGELFKDNQDTGILICASGLGMSIGINRFHQMRGALCRNCVDADLARRHNNANVLVLGSLFTAFEDAIDIYNIFSKTHFEKGRHLIRVEKLNMGWQNE